MSYKIHLDVFEGPVDLLLYFIKRDEINIYDIPITKVTRDYLGYLDMMTTLNLQLAGEFVAMAAMLMRIKAKMLIPRVKEGIENEEIEDPRNELVQRLLEYQYFKEIGGELQKLEAKHAGEFPRKPNWNYIDHDLVPEDALNHISLFDILNAYKQAMDRMPKDANPHEVEIESSNIAEQVDFIYSHLHKSPRVNFSTLIKEIKSKLVLLVTLMALLDMMRAQQIRVIQAKTFDDFVIEQREPGD
ncbi:MAG: segregation/condensation protein A [Candidatus Marinimicrobia bacterium]|nr:segregation/condensation protein A [Candidatus Neomarinimicrobiota bacterium]